MEPYMKTDDHISIGEMAERFDTSTRTLRLYHNMGLLVPQYVNEATGYRYYSRSQFQRMEKILQMKASGLSLKQIKSMMDDRNLTVFEALLNEQIDQLNERIAQDTANRDMLLKQLNSCAQLRNPPVQNVPFIEFIPKRHAFYFDITPYDLRETYADGSPWTMAMEGVKEILAQYSISNAFLSQSCCTITQHDLMHNNYICSGAYLLTDDPVQSALPQTVIQSGTYACIYRNYTALDGQSECIGLDKLFDFIHAHGYHIVGPYLGEVVARMSIFDFNNNDILVKLQIPVRISDG